MAISGFFILPDVPEISNPWYLSEEASLLFQTFAFYAHINIKVGGQSRPNANEIRREKEQGAIHKIKVEENIHVVAHLSSDLALYVS